MEASMSVIQSAIPNPTIEGTKKGKDSAKKFQADYEALLIKVEGLTKDFTESSEKLKAAEERNEVLKKDFEASLLLKQKEYESLLGSKQHVDEQLFQADLKLQMAEKEIKHADLARELSRLQDNMKGSVDECDGVINRIRDSLIKNIDFSREPQLVGELKEKLIVLNNTHSNFSSEIRNNFPVFQQAI